MSRGKHRNVQNFLCCNNQKGSNESVATISY